MSEDLPKKKEEKIPINSNLSSEREKDQTNRQNFKVDELNSQLQSKNLIIEMIKKTIFPALKSRIEFLEEQLTIKEQKLDIFKMKKELSEFELDSPLPLPI